MVMIRQLEMGKTVRDESSRPMDDPLRIVTTAVALVVMVSATAVPISGVNARYISISDRVRTLAHE